MEDSRRKQLEDIAKKEGIKYGINEAANLYTTPSLPANVAGPVQQNPNSDGQIGAGALNLYDAYNKYKAGEKSDAAVSAGMGGGNIAAGLGNTTAAEAMPYVAAAYGGYKALSSNGTDKQKSTALRRTGEDTVAGVFSGGITTLAQAADRAFLGGQTDKLRDKRDKISPVAKMQDKVGAKILGSFNRGSSTHQEEKRRQALSESGINIPNAGVKEWENNEKFRQTRNEADLLPKDILNAAKFYEIKGYDKLSPAKKELIAAEALKRGLIREHHGTIDVGMNAEYQKFIDSTLSGGSDNKPKEGARRPAQRADDRREKAVAKKERIRASLSQIIPELDSPATSAPRYDLEAIDYSSHYKNPYI